MKDLSHLSTKKVELLCREIWKIRGGLRGISATLQQQSTETCFDGDELFGLGQLFEMLSDQLSRIEDILQRGYDSKAISKNYQNDEIEETIEEENELDEDVGQDSLVRELSRFLNRRKPGRPVNK